MPYVTEGGVALPTCSVTIEDAAKGEIRATVKINGDDWTTSVDDAVAAYKAVRGKVNEV